MSVQTAFTIITNIFGLNFFEQKVSLTAILFTHLAGTICNSVNIYYAIKFFNPTLKAVYMCIDFVQLILPLLITIFTTIRAILLYSFDKNFDEKTRKVYAKKIIRKNQIKFLVYVIACLVICIFKSSLSLTINDFVYNSSQIFPTMLNSASDFLFVYHINCLTDHLRDIGRTKCDVRTEMLKVIDIKRLIHIRYSPNLTLAITTYFFLIIFSLFWIFMRILFGYLNTIYGKWTDRKD